MPAGKYGVWGQDPIPSIIVWYEHRKEEKTKHTWLCLFRFLCFCWGAWLLFNEEEEGQPHNPLALSLLYVMLSFLRMGRILSFFLFSPPLSSLQTLQSFAGELTAAAAVAAVLLMYVCYAFAVVMKIFPFFLISAFYPHRPFPTLLLPFSSLCSSRFSRFPLTIVWVVFLCTLSSFFSLFLFLAFFSSLPLLPSSHMY